MTNNRAVSSLLMWNRPFLIRTNRNKEIGLKIKYFQALGDLKNQTINRRRGISIDSANHTND
ncbi:MAG: hypothetical protein ACJAQ7_002087 [Sediminicola sp.]|jgi:hypothetical protein